MVEYVDPLHLRLEHARDQLNRKIKSGEALAGEDLVSVRDDVVFVYQSLGNELQRLEAESIERDAVLNNLKMNKNPTLVKALWILLPTFAGGLLAFIGYVVGQGGG